MSDPLISVIIVAYNRREFIREAVKSVANQTLPKDEYELIVVKNFEDAYVDEVVKNMKGKSLLADLISYGATVTLAIEKAEGDVICFLDDDDMYSPWRLEVIRDKFKHNPSLIYYHNNVLVVDELGKPILDSSIEKTNINEEVFASTSEEKLASFIRYGWNLGLRNSSIAVKREFISKWLNIVRLNLVNFDVLIFMLALLDKGSILHDPRRLTYYRISSANTSIARSEREPFTRFHKAIKYSFKHALDRHGLVTIASHFGLRRYVKYDESCVIGGIYGNWSKWLSKVVIDLMTCRSMTCLGSAVLGAIYYLSPWLAKRMVYLYYTRLSEIWGLRS